MKAMKGLKPRYYIIIIIIIIIIMECVAGKINYFPEPYFTKDSLVGQNLE
jgi:hypothetical protein